MSNVSVCPDHRSQVTNNNTNVRMLRNTEGQLSTGGKLASGYTAPNPKTTTLASFPMSGAPDCRPPSSPTRTDRRPRHSRALPTEGAHPRPAPRPVARRAGLDAVAGSVGVKGFEPSTSCTQSRPSTRLRYTPERLRPTMRYHIEAVRPPFNPECVSCARPGGLASGPTPRSDPRGSIPRARW